MPIHSIERLVDGNGAEIGIRIYGTGHPLLAGGYGEVLYADIPGNSWNANRLAKFTTIAQGLFDYRIPLTDPSLVDDPAGPNGADPGRPDFFWDAGDLVSRTVVISDVSWDGTKLKFKLTKAGPA